VTVSPELSVERGNQSTKFESKLESERRTQNIGLRSRIEQGVSDVTIQINIRRKGFVGNDWLGNRLSFAFSSLSLRTIARDDSLETRAGDGSARVGERRGSHRNSNRSP
jgi:hypothetical protein